MNLFCLLGLRLMVLVFWLVLNEALLEQDTANDQQKNDDDEKSRRDTTAHER